MPDIVFNPPASLAEFWHSDRFYQWIIGPLGSTKTTNVIMKLMSVACNQAPNPLDGKRHTRFVLARNTLPQLKTTVLTDIQQWFPGLYTLKVAENKLEFRFGDVVSDWYMLPLSETEDQRRLLSMQLTLVYFNEFREIPIDLVAAAAGRVGRFPSKAHGGCTYAGVWGDSNPPSESSEWYNFLVKSPPSNMTYVHQPGAFDPGCDWRQYLPDNYYENLLEGHDPTWIDVHIHSKWGEDVSGQAVFRNTFSPSRHIVDQLNYDPTRAIVVGIDTGRNPAAVFVQLDVRGRVLVLSSVHAENMGIKKFLLTKVKPHVAERYPMGRFFVSMDPAARQRSQIGEQSVIDAVREEGFTALLASTNDIEPRLRALEKPMLLMLDDSPGLLIDRSANASLITALSYEYRYSRRRDGDLEEKPEKKHPWSDLVDALGYGVMNVNSNAIARAVQRQTAKPQAPKFSSAAWT
jgi:hypothetical protein